MLYRLFNCVTNHTLNATLCVFGTAWLQTGNLHEGTGEGRPAKTKQGACT